MRNFKNITILVVLLCSSISTASEKSTNYPIYNLNNVISYEVSEDSGSLFTLEQNEAGHLFVGRDMASGNTILSVQLDLPEAYFVNTVIVDDVFYVFHVRILNREKRLSETSIFKINCQSGQTENIYQSDEMRGFAEHFYATEKGLLLTEKRGNRPFFFDLETNRMTAIDLGDEFRIRAFDLDKNSAVIIKQSDFNTSFKSNDEKSTYTEGDGSLLDVYICDFSDGFNLNKAGQYQPNYVLSKNEDEAFLPHFLIEDSNNAWVGPSFMVNRFPISPGALIGSPFLYTTWESLVGYEMINKITFVNDRYALADQFSEMGETSLAVFDIKNPTLEKAETVSKTDRERIKSLFMGKATTEKSLLDPAVLSLVFDARFYKIDLVTTTVESSDDGEFTFSSTESFLAVARDGVYSVLKKNEDLVVCLSDGFILNEKSAPLFQDALDVLFPVGHFAEKHKAFRQQGDQWIFVRDESFGDKTGITVKVSSEGRVVAMEPDGELSN